MKFTIKNRGELLLGDCLEKLRSFKDDTFDHCITDPPYNISGYDNKKKIGWYQSNPTWKNKKSYNKIDEDWDSFTDQDYLIFTRDWIQEVKRVTKPNGNIFIFGTYHNIYKVGFILEALDTRIVNSVIWYKRNAFPNITQRMFCESTEQIVWAVNNSKKNAKNWTFNYSALKEMTSNKKQMRNMWDIPMTSSVEKEFGKHPSQKPMEIADRLILGCTNEGQTILDPFFGSGTFLLSALKNNRNFLGIDNNKEYFNLAQMRLKN